jgi:hypothetical protein
MLDRREAIDDALRLAEDERNPTLLCLVMVITALVSRASGIHDNRSVILLRLDEGLAPLTHDKPLNGNMHVTNLRESRMRNQVQTSCLNLATYTARPPSDQ